MSIEAMSCAWHYSKHESGNLLTLLAIADHANDDGVCWPSYTTLAKKCRLTDRHVRRCVSELVDSGELIILKTGTGRKSNLYQINFSQLRRFETGQISMAAHVPPDRTPMPSKSSIEPSLSLREEEQPVTIDSQANSIYAHYPLKVGKPAALIKIKKAIRQIGFDALMQKTIAFAVAIGSDLEYCPHPSTWYHQQRFNDDPSTWKRKNGTNQQNTNPSSRTIGTANEGRASDYANAGKV